MKKLNYIIENIFYIKKYLLKSYFFKRRMENVWGTRNRG